MLYKIYFHWPKCERCAEVCTVSVRTCGGYLTDNTQTEVSADIQSVMESRSSLEVMMRKEERSRSPVSVHQWVAALPDITKDTESEERGEEREQDVDDDDNLTLGAEGESQLESLSCPHSHIYSRRILQRRSEECRPADLQ